MKQEKLRADLAERLTGRDEDELLDVIVELAADLGAVGREGAAGGRLSRAERIAARQEAFERGSDPVERAIREAGGEVTGRAWINRTVRARVPARGLDPLSELDEVAAIDAPRSLRLE